MHELASRSWLIVTRHRCRQWNVSPRLSSLSRLSKDRLGPKVEGPSQIEVLAFAPNQQLVLRRSLLVEPERRQNITAL